MDNETIHLGSPSYDQALDKIKSLQDEIESLRDGFAAVLSIILERNPSVADYLSIFRRSGDNQIPDDLTEFKQDLIEFIGEYKSASQFRANVKKQKEQP